MIYYKITVKKTYKFKGYIKENNSGASHIG